MDRFKTFALTAVTILLVVSGVAMYGIHEGYWNHSPADAGTLTAAQLASLNATGAGTTVDAVTSTIYVNNSSTLLVQMGPMNVGNMYSFEMYGLVNPTVVIRENVTVKFTSVNVDTDDSHNFELVREGPPYAYMGGQGMMGGFANADNYGPMSTMPYIGPMHSGTYNYFNTTYNFGTSGTYWYICTYPGHAQNGMYGKIVVS